MLSCITYIVAYLISCYVVTSYKYHHGTGTVDRYIEQKDDSCSIFIDGP